MLEFIKNWVVAITVAVLLGAILEMFLPQSSIKKYAKTAIAITIMLVIITPVIGIFNGDINIQKELDKIFTGSNQVKVQTENNPSLYKDYVYEVYMRDKNNKNE